MVSCPFCPGREGETPEELWADRPRGAPDTPGWRARVFPNKYPAIAGEHEVIAESADHDADLSTMSDAELARVLGVYARRVTSAAARTSTRYVQLFRNAGRAAGATQSHPHAQLLALPIVPPVIRDEMRGAEACHEQRGRCVFCELAASDPSEHHVMRSAAHVAYAPPAPRVPCETWIQPLAHAACFSEEVGVDDLAVCLGSVLRRVSRVLGDPAYTLYLHHAPVGAAGSVSYHWHFELLPRTTGVAGFELATSVFINPMAPETAAERMRDAG